MSEMNDILTFFILFLEFLIQAAVVAAAEAP